MTVPTMTAARGEVTIPDPPVAHALFSTTRFAWLFVVVRLFLGWQWLQSGWGKAGNPKWVETGEALRGYWLNAVTIPAEGRPPISYDWYRAFIQLLLDTESYTWFAKLIVYGELLIGLGLIVGAFVGIAAFFGAFMNWNFIMAGTASTNALLFVLAVFLMLGWKVAGYYGLDRYLLPYLGTPWGSTPDRAEAPAGQARRML